MKKLVLAFVACVVMLGFASLYGEQMDHWDIISSTITDGEWTFNVGKRGTLVSGTSDVYDMWILECAEAPSQPTMLDFSKPLVNTGGSTKYAIVNIKPYGDTLRDADKPMVKHLRLPTHGLGVMLNDAFKECSNLESVEPFLSADCKVGGSCFSGCAKLSSPLVVTGKNWEDNIQKIFLGTAIPSVDMTESPIAALDRGVFANNPALTTVKLSASLTSLQGTEGPFAACTALVSVEFHSVPSGLNNGFRNSNQPSWPTCDALSAVHFYNCAPTASPSATIYEKVASGKVLTTYLHDMSDEQLAAWGEYCAEDGVISDFSTWKKSLAGNPTYLSRPILVYSVKHVSLAAGQDGAAIAGRPGTFIISRADDDAIGGSVVVNYTIVGGTAEEGEHFKPLSGVAEIPAGEKSGVIEVSPSYFGYIGTETLSLKLAEGDYEIVEGEDEATISLSTEALRSVSIAKGEDADEGTGKVGYFILSRGDGDSVEGPVDVSLSFGGTAVAGQTYRAIKNVVTIPAGEQTLKVKVVPYDDPVVAEDSAAEVTIAPGGYGIGTASTSVAIKNGATYGGWKFVDGSHISDDKWTFTVSRRPNAADSFEDGTRHLWVQGCTAWPTEVSTLDFGKAFHNYYDSTYYMIRKFESAFSGKDEAAAALGSLVLPNDSEYKFEIYSGCYKGCTNLTSVTPFLPAACESLTGAFAECKSLATPLVILAGTSIGDAGTVIEQFAGCEKIPSADLSQSTVKSLCRSTFHRCLSLEWIKLPACFEKFGSADDDSYHNRDPFWDHNFPQMATYAATPKLYFYGTTMPLLKTDVPSIGSLEFMNGLDSIPDNAFSHYTGLTNVVINGEPPATIGENIFSGFKAKTITVNVPAYYIADWREIADDGKLTIKDGGTWTSGTTQLLVTYGDPRGGLLVIVR